MGKEGMINREKKLSSQIDSAIYHIAIEISNHDFYEGLKTDLEQDWVDEIVIKHQQSFSSIHGYELRLDDQKIRRKLISQNLV